MNIRPPFLLGDEEGIPTVIATPVQEPSGNPAVLVPLHIQFYCYALLAGVALTRALR